jgi:hypothetical protein
MKGYTIAFVAVNLLLLGHVDAVDFPDGMVLTIAGDGDRGSFVDDGNASSLVAPRSLVIFNSSTAFVSDASNMIRSFDFITGEIRIIAGSLNSECSSVDGVGQNASLCQINGLALARDSTDLVVYTDAGCRSLNLSNLLVSSITCPNDPEINGVSLSQLHYVPNSTIALVANPTENRIRMINTSTGAVSTLAGYWGGKFDMGSYKEGVGTHALFKYPTDVAVTQDGALAIVADKGNNCIRTINLSSAETRPLAGLCTAQPAPLLIDGVRPNATLTAPTTLRPLPGGPEMLFAGPSPPFIRAVDTRTGAVRSIAGGGRGYADGRGSAALFGLSATPEALLAGLSPDGAALLVLDRDNNRIRKIFLSGACRAQGVADPANASDWAPCVCRPGFSATADDARPVLTWQVPADRRACAACPDGLYKLLPGPEPCDPCPLGTVAAADGGSCATCSGARICQLLPSGEWETGRIGAHAE